MTSVPIDEEFHPELRALARIAPRATITNPATMKIMRRLSALRPPQTSGIRVQRLGADTSIRIYDGAHGSSSEPALLWIHGGGYVMGRAHLDDRLCRSFAAALGITVASVDYRLAPENPYPAALLDCHAALHRVAEIPGVDPDRIAIGGLSAGAGLAAALAIRLRDHGDLVPALQLLAYPMLDDRSSAAAHPLAPRYRFWNQASNRYSWRAYLAAADPAVAVPARRDDLSGLAPAWIGVGSLDLFHYESVTYAQRLRTAGVACRLEVIPGAFHGFDAVAPKTSVAQAFFARQCLALNDVFRGD
ncbi:esterase/lipase [Mycolicibacterium chubuense NBB4]|uniref:Esterase/lipase n=1 Tax=Mycolicibacterium chubuense (strain NBB4) TaxID=710421 RepID=I4BG38_MYCCN|nr:alpha/beta hydrolase [Mycolicibacterium chubuense]AFM16245.1 esterase/lipase [Mycolicibacterium chubuense NBB4]